MKINLNEIKNNVNAFEKAGIKLPKFDIEKMKSNTEKNPEWLHFGAGNIFRGYIAVIAQRLLESGEINTGIVAAETFDHEIVDKIYDDYDNLTLNVILNSDETIDTEIIASVSEALKIGAGKTEDETKLIEIFTSPSLKMVSFTITEKGYFAGGDKCVPAIITRGLFERYKSGKTSVAMVSMDNCSGNGKILKKAVLSAAESYNDSGFIDYLSDERKVSFPCSMIDKITPRPAKIVEEMLEKLGVQNISPIITEKNTYIAPFVNAERAEYLVIEDNFANGKLPLHKAGVYITDRETVEKAERMKVTTCLNPLHTAMSVYGCLLRYNFIHEEMKDKDIVKLIRRLAYTEGLPVVEDPVIISPADFADEVINERLPNPFMPDMPQRIATDTSQKVGIRFGETIKRYIKNGKSLDTLVSVPLAIAGWMRYLLGVSDSGELIEVSSDPMKDELQAALSGIVWDKPESYNGELLKILSNKDIFGLDLVNTILYKKIEEMFISQLHGKGAVRKTLKKYLSE